MTRAELEREYRVEGNRIISPGKFNHENIWAPYFWEFYLNGETDEEYDDDGRLVTRCEIFPDDVREFPELEGFRIVEMYENDDGFVFCEVRP
jgi:hypothetical protein